MITSGSGEVGYWTMVSIAIDDHGALFLRGEPTDADTIG
jgi:hypothetical protein